MESPNDKIQPPPSNPEGLNPEHSPSSEPVNERADNGDESAPGSRIPISRPPNSNSIPFQSERQPRAPKAARPRPRTQLGVAPPPVVDVQERDRAQIKRRLWLIAGGLMALTLVGWAVVKLGAQLKIWLGSQSVYQSKPEDMELDPAPPTWLTAGKTGILSRVRKEANWPEEWSVLDRDLDQIAKDMKFHCPWAEEVVRVERVYPNRIKVTLVYRKPIARFSQVGLKEEIVIDKRGVLLPPHDIDMNYRNCLVRIDTRNDTGDRLEIPLPKGKKYGSVWGHYDLPNDPLEPAEQRVVHAAELASFLLEDPQSSSPAPAPTWVQRLIINPTIPDVLYILVERNIWARWGSPLNSKDSLNDSTKRSHFFEWGTNELKKPIPSEEVIYDISTQRYLEKKTIADK